MRLYSPFHGYDRQPSKASAFGNPGACIEEAARAPRDHTTRDAPTRHDPASFGLCLSASPAIDLQHMAAATPP